jgi:pyruvate formate lyase activating enzyme
MMNRELMIHMEARYYSKLDIKKVKCLLCPHHCVLESGQSGICRVRSNRGGILYADSYGQLSAANFDPIEKKPLYHFHPGHEILSLGSLGCNFQCRCCQNYSISQSDTNDFPRVLRMSTEELKDLAIRTPGNIGIAFTYNEPTVWYEYMSDIAEVAKKADLCTVMVSNGYINIKPLTGLLDLIDAFNIDLKAFDEGLHRNFTGGNMKPVLNTLKKISSMGKHLEITILIVPELNDNINEFRTTIRWISNELGKNTPLHISRYYPNYKYQASSTPSEILRTMAEIAAGELNFVYLGNVATKEFRNTYCPACKALIIIRKGYQCEVTGLNSDGTCKRCSCPIAIT